jgi:peptidoglycan glycosyltransferase
MTLERRVWRMGVLFVLLLLLVSLRMVYWQLAPSPAGLPDTPADVAAGRPEDDGNQAAAPGLETATAEVTAEAVTVVVPTETPTPTVTIETPTPTATIELAAIGRGVIYDRNGRRLAYDVQDGNGNLARYYSEPSLAHVVGYVSGLRLGVAGIERSYDRQLFDLENLEKLYLDSLDHQRRREPAPRNAQSQVYLPLISKTQALKGPVERPIRGNDVYLTIDSRVQRAAAQALSGKAGAIVVMDARTGALLAMASSPTFDPNRILDPDYVHELESCNGSVNCRQALFNRAAQGLYTPGSTWKTVTLIAALETGQVTSGTVFDFGQPLRDANGRTYYVYTVDGFSIKDPNHQERRLDLARCYAVSANAAFARIGDEMPADAMIEYAARLGFGRTGDGVPPIEIDASAARLAIDPQQLARDNPLRASTAIGQGEVQVSPLSIALMTAAVVNDGDIPIPHLVQSVNDPAGDLLEGEPTGHWIEDTMRPETAEQVRAMMIQVVRNGSGYRANVPGFVVGGKTGTAQTDGDLAPHAWFTGFVQSDEETIVITVIVEHGGEGSQVAAPLFAQVADVVMRHRGEPVEEVVGGETQ